MVNRWVSVDSVTKLFPTDVVAANIPDSSTTVKGIVELATSTETVTGTDNVRAVTPSGLAAKVSSTSAQGLVELATSAETITGTDTARAVTPAGLQAKVSSETALGIVELATSAETVTGSSTSLAVHPAGVKAVADRGESAVNTVATSGATETLSAANTMHKVTMDQACTFTFTSPSAGAVFALLLSGAFTPTFPASVDWPDGTPPTYTTPSLYVFSTFDGGTTWQGVQAGKAFA